MPELQIKNLKGMNFQEGLWNQGFSKYVLGIDVFGLQDNPTRISIPGVLQGMRTMNAGTEAAATNDITDLIGWFAYFPTSASVWGLAGSSSPRLYERASATWTLRRSTAGSDLVTASSGGGLASFGGSLWTAQNAVVSRWDGTTWTATFGTFTSATASPRPMRVFAGALMIGNTRYISQINSTPAFTANQLTLPADFTVKSLEVFGDRLYIMADNGDFTRMFIWDGVNTTAALGNLDWIDLLDETVAPTLIHAQGYLWAIANRGAATPGVPIYIFDGSNFNKIMVLPLGRASVYGGDTQSAFGLTSYRGGLLIASSDPTSADYEDGVGGVWMINRHDANHPWQAVLAFNPSGGAVGTTVGGIYASGQNIFVATKNQSSSAYEVWEAHGSDTNVAGIWQSLPIDAGDASRNKIWHGIQIDSELSVHNSGSSAIIPNVIISYRLNYATSWTTLKTVSNTTTGQSAYFSIGRSSKVIEIRVELDSNAGTLSTRFHGFTLKYSPQGQ